ncbi:hypothetical protein F4558_001634 [Micromonospora profundi]|uniref:hypothetical protein n=1 Tax=Micromonospora profundi TaxID=1420889 RepID=UPI0014392A91|nr:hypothetical protein [Micromonospora profundi]NJC11808.1 hypothetical protein [Micromonospora profundi]
MPAIVALTMVFALTPAPTPTPTPTPSTTSGPVGSLLGGVGQIVDGLLGGGSASGSPVAPSPTPTDGSAPTPPAAVVPPGASAAPPSASGSASAPGMAPGQLNPAGPGRVARDAVVPGPSGDASDSLDSPALGAPERSGWPLGPGYYLLFAGVLAVLALLLLRRPRAARVAGAAPAPAPAPAPTPTPALAAEPEPEAAPAHAPDLDCGPVPDNVSRLPTNLNAIYELGRLDERLEQERGRPTS